MLLSKTLIFVAFVSIPRVALAQQPADETSPQRISDKIDNDVTNESDIINERLFVQLFVKRRKEHLDAVKNIRKMTSYEKKYKMVTIIADNAFNIIESSRGVIEGMKFVPKDSTPLKNITVRSALSAILENSALFGDVVLQLPDITRRIIKSQQKLNTTIQWSMNFVIETRHLLDEPTLIMFDLARQELQITPRDPNYTNPYWPRSNKKQTFDQDKKGQKSISKKMKKSKGPQIINIEL